MIEPLIDKRQTGARMKMLAGRFARDLDGVKVRINGKLKRFSDLNPAEVHEVVRNIPYKRDTEPVEVIARPARLLNGEFERGIDCKKKAVLIGAWAARRGYPYKFVATSKRPDRKFHHVFPVVRLGGEWVNMDATYATMRPGTQKRGTAFEVL